MELVGTEGQCNGDAVGSPFPLDDEGTDDDQPHGDVHGVDVLSRDDGVGHDDDSCGCGCGCALKYVAINWAVRSSWKKLLGCGIVRKVREEDLIAEAQAKAGRCKLG